MSVDPIQQIVLARPRIGDIPEAGDGVVVTQGTTRPAQTFDRGDLNDLSALPGSPGHAAKMAALAKQARLRGEVVEILGDPPAPLLDASGTVLATPPLPDPNPIIPPLAQKRVAIYYGKHETYNVAIESAPDWDTVKIFKEQTESGIRIILGMAEALGLRVSDKTGDFSE